MLIIGIPGHFMVKIFNFVQSAGILWTYIMDVFNIIIHIGTSETTHSTPNIIGLGLGEDIVHTTLLTFSSKAGPATTGLFFFFCL